MRRQQPHARTVVCGGESGGQQSGGAAKPAGVTTLFGEGGCVPSPGLPVGSAAAAAETVVETSAATGATGAGAASEAGSASAASKEAKWGNPKTLQDHFDRHGSDFGAKTPGEYSQKATDFSSQPGTLKKADTQGTTRVYDQKTNTFGSYNSDGSTKTFYKPDPSQHGMPSNWDYWLSQPGK